MHRARKDTAASISAAIDATGKRSRACSARLTHHSGFVTTATSEHAHSPDRRAALPVDTRLALVRTRLAFERTLMAWVRTAVSLITFGFTLYKAVDLLGQHEAPALKAHTLDDARLLGVLMVGIGVVALLLATGQHLRHVEKAHKLDQEIPVVTVGAVVAVVISAIGIWLLIRITAA
jgi:putative membrane protein